MIAPQYYYATNNQPVGPVSFSDLERLVKAGALPVDVYVIREGDSQWRPFREIDAVTMPAQQPVVAPPATPAQAPVLSLAQVPTPQPAAAPVPPTANANPPVSPAPFVPVSGKKRFPSLIAVVVLICVAAVGGYVWFTSEPDNPRKDAMKKEIMRDIGDEKNVDVAAIKALKFTNDGDTVNGLFKVDIATAAPHYERLHISSLIAENGGNPADFDLARSMLRDGDSKRVLELANIDKALDLLGDCDFGIKTQNKGDIFVSKINVRAFIKNGEYRYKISDGEEPKFKGKICYPDERQPVAYDAAAKARIVSAIAALKDALPKLTEASQRYKVEKTAAAEAKITQMLGNVSGSNALYAGSVTRSNGTTALAYMEVVKLDKEHKSLVVALRNDGGWKDFRTASGSYEIQDGTLVITLSLQKGDMLRDCGPILEWGDDPLAIKFSMNGETLFGTVGSWVMQLDFVPPEKRADTIARASENEQKLLDATKVGAMYLVTATLPDSSFAETYIVTFTRNDRDGKILEAQFEDIRYGISNNWKRSYTGTLVTNTYKAKNEPIQMYSKEDQRSQLADRRGMLGWNRGNENCRPHYDNGKLFYHDSGDANLDEVFTPTTPEEVAALRSAEQEKIDAVVNFLRASTRFNGMTNSDDGKNASRITLKIANVTKIGYVYKVTGSLDSLDVPEAKRPFYGSFDPVGLTMHITITINQGRCVDGSILRERWFNSNNDNNRGCEYNFTFSLDPAVGNIEARDYGWTLTLKTTSKPKPPSASKTKDAGAVTLDMAMSLRDSCDYEDAIEAFGKIIEAASSDDRTKAEALLWRGNILHEMAQFERAREDLDTVIGMTSAPDAIKAQAYYGRAGITNERSKTEDVSGDYKAAISLCDKALASGGTSTDETVRLLVTRGNSKNNIKANGLVDVQRATEISGVTDYNRTLANFSLAFIKNATGDPTAQNDFRRLLDDADIQDNFSARALLLLALKKFNSGDNTGASEDFLKIIEMEKAPKLVKMYANFFSAQIMVSNKNYNESSKYYTAVIDMSEDATELQASSLDMRGWSQLVLGNLDAAMQDFKRVINITLIDPAVVVDAKYGLGMTYIDKKDMKNARIMLNDVLNDPNVNKPTRDGARDLWNKYLR